MLLDLEEEVSCWRLQVLDDEDCCCFGLPLRDLELGGTGLCLVMISMVLAFVTGLFVVVVVPTAPAAGRTLWHINEVVLLVFFFELESEDDDVFPATPSRPDALPDGHPTLDGAGGGCSCSCCWSAVWQVDVEIRLDSSLMSEGSGMKGNFPPTICFRLAHSRRSSFLISCLRIRICSIRCRWISTLAEVEEENSPQLEAVCGGAATAAVDPEEDFFDLLRCFVLDDGLLSAAEEDRL